MMCIPFHETVLLQYCHHQGLRFISNIIIIIIIFNANLHCRFCFNSVCLCQFITEVYYFHSLHQLQLPLRLLIIIQLCYALVDKATDTAAIKKAHRKQSLRFHPDRALDQDEREEFVEKQSQLNDAMNVLLNPEKREVYDKAQFLTGMGEEAVRTFESHKQPEAYKNFDLSQKNIDPTKMVRHKEKADTKEMEVNLTFKQCMTGIFQKQEVYGKNNQFDLNCLIQANLLRDFDSGCSSYLLLLTILRNLFSNVVICLIQFLYSRFMFVLLFESFFRSTYASKHKSASFVCEVAAFQGGFDFALRVDQTLKIEGVRALEQHA
ncbi:Chaperone_protein DnaJ subfamily B [Hexamita inflata]|uniref:Chaperone_protein DnaJ subfamily B n=1 Tax=Hexamita inflata TaxID=28002 RepID=A0ABP1K3R1_9EUKA